MMQAYIYKNNHIIYIDKRAFFRIQFLVNQYTIENLFIQESKAFRDFQLIKLPTDWKSKLLKFKKLAVKIIAI